ncbi:ABC transporter ATP-binding protein [Saccharopolyspora hattusasensis]|uniref:ABC transporter ATP-binding protein n=1 Tax=Saccharopolyspora hattusasensis TaxID=1128679 RepID=UPI003D964497
MPRSHQWAVRLLRDCRQHRRLTVVVVASAALGTGLAGLLPLITRAGVDAAMAGQTGTVGPLVTALLGIAVVQFAASFVRQFSAGKLALDVQHDLRIAVFGSLQRLDGQKHDALRTGQVMSRANLDLQLVQGLLAMAPQALGSLVLIVVSLAAMLWLSPSLAMIALALLAASAGVTARASRRLYPATWAVQQRSAEISQHVEETVTGVRVVRGFAQEQRETGTLRALSERLFGERMRVARMQSGPGAWLGILPPLGQVAVLLLGGWLAVRGGVSVGSFLAFSSYLIMLTAPAGTLSNVVLVAQQARPAVVRVYELIDTHAEVRDAPDARDLPDGPLGVTLEDVEFGYTRDEPVLAGLSLRVRPGETVALVGGSGSGKSTVALLLSRFYDATGGRIRIGPPGAETDVRAVRLDALRRAVGVVFEEPFLFSRSIAENIGYGVPDAGLPAIRAAARAAGADEFIRALPQGYDTVVGERGLTLSGGQRQRIALARTLLTDPRVLVLDDATSAVDTATEARINAKLRSVTAERTTLVVAHRRATLALADRIAVLDRGRVVDVGTERELRARCPLFTEFLAASADRIDESPATGDLWPHPELVRSVLDDPAAVDAAEHDPDLVAQAHRLRPAADRPTAAAADPPDDDRTGFWRILRPARWLLALAFVLIAADAVATTALPALIRFGVDHGVLTRQLLVVWAVAGVALVVVALNWLVLLHQLRATTRGGESVLLAMRMRSYRKLQRLGLDYYEREPGGRIMTRMTEDLAALSSFVEGGLTVGVVNLATVLVMLVAMLLIDVGLALTGMVVLPVVLVATLVFRHYSNLIYHRSRERVGEVNADLQENVAGLRTSQANGRQQRATSRFAGLSNRYRQTRVGAQRYIALYFPFVTLMAETATALVLGSGVHRVVAGTLTPGVLIAFLLYLTLFFAPFQQLSMVFDSYQRAKVGVRRVGELLDTPISVPQAPEAVPVPRRLRGEIELRGVGYRYPGSAAPAVSGLDLRMRPGERIALVGATGSGKSTVVKLLARMYDPSEGSITVDGIELREYDMTGYRGRLGLVPQEPHLFSGDVAANVRYGRPGASDAEVTAAVREVGALDVIAALPGGFRFQVGERGQRLSTGQRQLIALARAALVRPDILLLDEPTAALDQATEAAVLAAYDRLSLGRTTVLVTHRLSTAAQADRIVVLEQGRIVETGTHERLLGRSGAYERLLRFPPSGGQGVYGDSGSCSE